MYVRNCIICILICYRLWSFYTFPAYEDKNFETHNMRVRFCLLTCLNRYHDRAMSFMKKNTLSILKICQSLFGGAKKGKGPFIYYVSTLLYFWTPISPMYVGIFIALKVSKKKTFFTPPPLYPGKSTCLLHKKYFQPLL